MTDIRGCQRNCPDGECYCSEPTVAEFLFPDGDPNEYSHTEWWDDEE